MPTSSSSPAARIGRNGWFGFHTSLLRVRCLGMTPSEFILACADKEEAKWGPLYEHGKSGTYRRIVIKDGPNPPWTQKNFEIYRTMAESYISKYPAEYDKIEWPQIVD